MAVFDGNPGPAMEGVLAGQAGIVQTGVQVLDMSH